MQLIPVASRADEKEFLQLPATLYAGQEAWIRPLDADIKAVFDPSANKAFIFGECQRWLLKERGRVIGRIAAFFKRTKDLEDGLSAGVGFFECIDKQEAANLLFDAARDWLAVQGATYMDGPVNFGRRDKWWGLLTRGFDLEPNYQSNYHLPYYQKLFEQYGFKTYYQQYTFRKAVFEPLSKRLEQKAALVAKDPAYTFEHLKIGQLDRFTKDIMEVYNKAWVKHEGVVQLTMAQARSIIDRLRPILDEKIIWVGYYEGAPVAIFVCIPEVNQILKHVDGRMDLWGKLKFFWHKIRGRNKKMLGMVFGVVPQHQGKGVDGAIIHAMARILYKEKRYETLEMTGIGDFNPKMILVVRQVGGQVCKVHTTYRYLFDREQPFERMKSIR